MALCCVEGTLIIWRRRTSLVTWFDEDTPVALIADLKPDVLVKGGDYDLDSLAETAL